MDTRSQSNLICGFVNIQSVGNKTIEIRVLIVEKSFDILALAETWLSAHDKAKIHEMTSNTHLFTCSQSKQGGGGVGILINNELPQIKLLSLPKFDTFESMAVSFLVNGNHKQIFVVVYRPPQTSRAVFIEEFTTYLEHFDNAKDSIFICGDFNFKIDVNDQH